MNSGLGPIIISIYCFDVLSKWIHSACGLEPINICPTISESILSVMCQEFPTVRFRQALNHLKHIGDCFIYWSRSIDVWIEPMKQTQHEVTYFRVACDCLSCYESVICADTIRLAY